MNRDWTLIRMILRKIEEKSSYGDVVRPDVFDGYLPEVVSYHMSILDQAGLISARCQESGRRESGIFCVAMNLTWDGHELLDSIRNDTVWNRLKSVLREKSVDLSYGAVKAAAMHLIKESLF